MTEYYGNFSRLVNHGVPFTRLLVAGRQVQRVSDTVYHVIGTDTLMHFSSRSRVYRFKGYKIVKDSGRYHVFK